MRELDFADSFTSASAPGSTTTEQSIANNQVSAANITSLSFSSSSYRGAVIEYDMRRFTDSSERRAVGELAVIYNTTSAIWAIVKDTQHNEGTDHGVAFTITAGGQVQYTSDNQAGTSYAGSMKWKVLRRYDA